MRQEHPLAEGGVFFAVEFSAGTQVAEAPTPIVRSVAFVLVVAGQAFGLWAMRVNRFFATFVRIEHERGFRVVTGGPYAIVRRHRAVKRFEPTRRSSRSTL